MLGVREAAWRLSKNIPKLKEKNETTFFSPSENRCLPTSSSLKPEEREFVVDCGASMHMISKKDLNSAESETLTTTRSPTTVITANGEVQTHEEATVCQRIGYILDNESPRGYASSLIAGKALRWTRILIRVDQQSKNHISSKTVFGYSATRRTCFRSWFLVYQRVLPQACPLQHQWHLRGRKLIILRLPQARLPHHPWHLQRRLIIQITLQQLCQAKVWLDENGETRMGRITIPQSCQVNVWKGKNGETCVLLESQKSSCWLSQPKIQNQIKTKTTIKNGVT